MDWTKFVRKIRIATDRQSAFLAWADTTKMTEWFLATCKILNPSVQRNIIQQGDTVEWSWHNYPNVSELEILEFKEYETLTFTFDAGMEVKVEFVDEGEYTVIILEQYNIPDDEKGKEYYHIGCRQAWSTWMLNLKSWLETGQVLHDKSLGHRDDLFDFVNT